MSGTLLAELVDAFLRFFAQDEFDDSQVVPTVEDLTGLQARTYEEWAAAHAEEFMDRRQ